MKKRRGQTNGREAQFISLFIETQQGWGGAQFNTWFEASQLTGSSQVLKIEQVLAYVRSAATVPPRIVEAASELECFFEVPFRVLECQKLDGEKLVELDQQKLQEWQVE